jgi:hypothetical protein
VGASGGGLAWEQVSGGSAGEWGRRRVAAVQASAGTAGQAAQASRAWRGRWHGREEGWRRWRVGAAGDAGRRKRAGEWWQRGQGAGEQGSYGGVEGDRRFGEGEMAGLT